MNRKSAMGRMALVSAAVTIFSAQVLFGQIAAPNESGVSIGHVHLMVRDPEVHKKLWTGVFGAEIVHYGTLEAIKLPGFIILLAKGEPAEGPATVDHFGLQVKDLASLKEKLAAANVKIPDGPPIATLPDGVRIELLEDKNATVPVAFHHYHIFTSDNAENIRDWYVKTFGAVASTRRGTMPTANIPGGEVDVLAQPNGQRAPTKGHPIDHIGFEVKGLEQFCKKLEAQGIKFEIPFRDVPQIGLKIAFIADPIGTRIELTEGLAGK